MEEFNKKLNSETPPAVAHILSKLVQLLKNKNENEIADSVEFKFLKEKCLSLNSAISGPAAQAVLKVVRCCSPDFTKSVLSDFITIVTTTKFTDDMAYLINNLLLKNLKNEISLGNNFNYFNLRLPQHPFIIMLNEDHKCWGSIFKEIYLLYKTTDQSDIIQYNELYKPVYLYCLCNPHCNEFYSFKQKLWTFMLQKAFPNNQLFLFSFLSWMQFENRDTIQINSDFLIELAELNLSTPLPSYKHEIILFWLVSSLHQLILHQFDPRALISIITKYILAIPNTLILNPIIITLAKCVAICPSIYLCDLIDLYQNTALRSHSDVLTRSIIKSSLLQWIANPSILIADASMKLNNFLAYLDSETIYKCEDGYLDFIKEHQEMISTNSEVYFTSKIYALLETWNKECDIISWLEKLSKAPLFFTVKMLELLQGFFLTRFSDVAINLKSFDLILKCVDFDKSLASRVLTMALFKLSNTNDPIFHFHILKTMPKLASKNDFQKVAGTIIGLNKGRNILKIYSASLMLDLWKVDNKCYSYLETLLIAPCSVDSKNKWHFFETRAYILRELCASKPELYGKDMVAHLSKILNECNCPEGAVACAFAIEGIALLCKSEIIDAVTTWDTLAPMFQTEVRIPVIKSVCTLISEFPHLSYSHAYPELEKEGVSKLWSYIVFNLNDEVWRAALESLSNFSIEQIIAQMPEEFFDEETLVLKKSGQIVPGTCWIYFLRNCTESKLAIAGDFLSKLISLEVSSYLKFVYQVKGTREPLDYSYLPIDSAVRGLSTYIKSQMLKWKNGIYKEVYLECLRVFSQEYSRPLPPLDWCFLQELFHEPEAKEYCVKIAAHQVVLSGTARRFIVNYIEALTQDYSNDKDVLLIYSNLKYLAKSIQPFTLKPFVELTLKKAVENFESESDDLLVNILKHLNTTLQNEDIQEPNKVVVAQIIGVLFNSTNISSKLFKMLLDSVILFPMKSIDELTSPKSVTEMSDEWFKKAFMTRCALVSKSNKAPLNLLNELIEVGSNFPKLNSFIFNQLAEVFIVHKDNTECVLWCLELIGQIQAVTAEKTEQKDILFLCNVFILAVVVFSGHYMFLSNFSNFKDLYNTFPRAVATLLDVNHWSICTHQALEWFYHMNTEKKFHKEYKNMFVQCLQALRHESEFSKNFNWIKYLNVEC